MKKQDNPLKKYRRSELLELLVEQGRRIEQLERQLDDAYLALAERRIELEASGSIAEAALRLNGVFESAELAARQYAESTSGVRAQPASEDVRRAARLLLSDAVALLRTVETEADDEAAEE